MKHRSDSNVWLFFLLLLGAAIRLAFWFIAEAKTFPDTDTYVEVARQLLSEDFSSYEGRRTLGYPLLIIFGHFSPDTIWLIQMLGGLGISACLFVIAYELTGSGFFAFVIGMTYNVNLGQLFLEANLIPETETIFFLAGALALTAFAHRQSRTGSRGFRILVVAGVLAGCAVMARPQFIFFPVLLGIAVGWGSLIGPGSSRLVTSARAGLIMAPGLFMILGWSWFNYAHVGHFMMSTHTGIGLTEHTIAFAELAPERYRTIRDVLVKHRDIHLAQTGRHTATWDALPDLKKATGLQLPDLDKQLLSMSKALILEYPLKYAVLVADAWVSFWLVSNPKGVDQVKPPVLAELLLWIWQLEHVILRSINAIFLLFAGVAVVSSGFRRRSGWGFVVTTISATVLASSILQAIAVGVDNTRYGVTVQPFIVLIVATAGYWILKTRPSQQGVKLAISAEPSKGGVR